MTITFLRMTATLLIALLAAACATPGQTGANQTSPTPVATATARTADTTEGAARTYTAADVDFMSGMIGHHSQAILMSKWAPSHGASPSIQTLALRIINAQQDEIAAMQKWLQDHHQPVPDVSAHGIMMKMGGMEHEMVMPGMLTDAQLKQLDEARGKEFDRLFLTFMIQHHQGAITMVNDLFGSAGAAQEVSVYKVASDAFADQTTEIDRMQKMLAALIFETNTP
ncbi:MAG TPA: DUF305 domain-containing protein [Gemmatimonadaceae bacterium]